MALVVVILHIADIVMIQQSCQCDHFLNVHCSHDCFVQLDLSHTRIHVLYSVVTQKAELVFGGLEVSNCLKCSIIYCANFLLYGKFSNCLITKF